MSINKISQNKWIVRVRLRIDGKMVDRKKTVNTRNEAKEAELELRKELEDLKAGKKRSLKITTLGQALIFYKTHTTAELSRVETYFNRLEKEIGTVSLNDLAEKFSTYLQFLKTERAMRTGEFLSPVTVNKMLVYAKTALSFCQKRRLINRNPLSGFSKLPEEARDRILTPDEEERLLTALECNNSYLLWLVKFCLKNPVRKGDLIELTRENFDRFRPWIHFYPSKTRKRKKRETVLPFLDKDLIEYFDSLPADCPYLFPRIDNTGNWYPLGDFKRHWHNMLEEAKIKDFRFHDLKHCAITWMLDNGYSERDILNLGIQYSPSMINRYYHTDAGKVLKKWKSTTQSTTPNNHQEVI